MKIANKYIAMMMVTMMTNPAFAIDSVSVEAGEGNMSSIYKLAVQNSMGENIPFLNKYDLTAYYEFSVAQIKERKYQNIAGQSHSLIDFGFTPFVRWQNSSKYGVYAEVGIGLNYMTDKYDNNDLVASTQFQFGDHIGAGYTFANNLDVLLKFQHYSNADIRKPNPAVNFVMLKLTYPF